MNSLDIYYSHLCRSDPPQLKALHADHIISCVVEEIYRWPCLLKNSPFLTEALNGTSVSAMDSFILIRGVLDRMKDPDCRTEGSARSTACLFTGMRAKNEAKMIEQTRRSLRAIKLLLPKQEPARKPKNASPSVYEAEKLRLLQERDARTRASLDRWQKEQDTLRESLRTLRPAAEGILKQLMSAEDRLAEEYILRFAAVQIHQYEVIADALDYHREKIRGSQDADYIHAVLNYEDFLYTIIDDLALFGIEEIRSDPGTPFDGEIHEARDAGFSPRRSVVKESLRSGFRCGQVILQKERVTTEVNSHETWN